MSCQNDCTTNSHDCVKDLMSLYQAYRDVSMGRQVKRVESSDMGRVSVVEYSKADIPFIASLYNDLYKKCGSQLSADYPSVLISDAKARTTTQRGHPVKGVFY